MSSAGLVDERLAVRRIWVMPKQVVYVKGIFEASEGVAVMFSDDHGEFTVVTPHDTATRLDEILVDLQAELGSALKVLTEPPSEGA